MFHFGEAIDGATVVLEDAQGPFGRKGNGGIQVSEEFHNNCTCFEGAYTEIN